MNVYFRLNGNPFNTYEDILNKINNVKLMVAPDKKLGSTTLYRVHRLGTMTISTFHRNLLNSCLDIFVETKQ